MTDDDRADKIVSDMVAFGAFFQLTSDGDGTKWLWEAKPPIMRNAIRYYWRSIEDKPSGSAMARAIRRARLVDGC